MKKLERKLRHLYVLFFRSRLFSTLKINFKTLPFKQAIRFPIVVYSKTNFRSLKGRIEIKGRLYFDMISIGQRGYIATAKPISTWKIEGNIVFYGPIAFYQGTYLLVAKDAILTFGNEKSSKNFESSITVGTNTKIMCFKSITIGEYARIPWDVQIIDTSFHYIENNGREAQILTKPIVIGDRVWIGNRSTISRGAIIPNNSIVCSNSVVNKDLSSYGENCMFAGSPAVKKGEGLSRIFDEQKQAEYDKKFGYNRSGL